MSLEALEFENRFRRSPSATCAVALLLTLVLSGCQAEYDLSGVASESRKSIRRSDDLQALAAHAGRLVAVGGRGMVVSSEDGGTTWKRTNLDGRPALIDIAACPDGSFVALDFGGAVYLTPSDTLGQWQRKALPGRDIALDLTCDSRGRIWVVGEFTSIRSSSDRGKTWSERTFDQDAIFTTIQFVDDQVGIIAGEFGSFLATADGGETWEWRPAIDGEFYPQSAAFSSPLEGWLVGLGGTVYHTQDQGQTWKQEHSSTRSPLFAITVQGGLPVAVGGLGTVIARRGSWQAVDLDPPVFSFFTGIARADGANFVAAGGNGQVRRFSLPKPSAGAPAKRDGS